VLHGDENDFENSIGFKAPFDSMVASMARLELNRSTKLSFTPLPV
jgi:hypothetical protein